MSTQPENLLRLLAETSEQEQQDSRGITIKIASMFFIALTSSFAFVPYLKCAQGKAANEGGDVGNYNTFKFVFCGNGRITSFSTSFACGMLMAMSLCHILPDTIAEYDAMTKEAAASNAADLSGRRRLQDGEGGHPMPWASLIYLGGFWIMLSLDQIIFKKNDEGADSQKEEKELNEQELEQIEVGTDRGDKKVDIHKGSVASVEEALKKVAPTPIKVDNEFGACEQDSERNGGNTALPKGRESELHLKQYQSKDGLKQVSGNSSSEESAQEKPAFNKAIVVFGIAVCLHGIIDGIALGVFTKSQLLMNLAIGLVLHRIPEAFVFGAIFYKKSKQLDTTIIVIFILFIITTPIGIGIGMGAEQSGNSLALIILQGFAGGAFLYMAVCDLLIEEFHLSEDLPELDEAKKNDQKHLRDRQLAQDKIYSMKFLSKVLGTAFVVILMAVEG